MRIPISLSMLPVLCSMVLSQSVVVVPGANSTTRGTTDLDVLTRAAGSHGTYMMGIGAQELALIQSGAILTGISFRAAPAAVTTSWPASVTSFSEYSISIGDAVPMDAWQTTFASNFFRAPVSVRSGAMVIEAKSIPALASVPVKQANEFSEFYWDLEEPFSYSGGNLAILITHKGGSRTSGTCPFDAVASGGNTRALSADTYKAATGASAAFCVVRLHFGTGNGCPGTRGKVPNFVLSNDVLSGGSATFAVSNGPPNAPAVYALGTHGWSWTLPNGCWVYHDAAVMVPVTLSGYGRATLKGTFQSGVYGAVYGQVFVLDPGATYGLSGSLAATLLVWP
jgi:hypothetical protein